MQHKLVGLSSKSLQGHEHTIATNTCTKRGAPAGALAKDQCCAGAAMATTHAEVLRATRRTGAQTAARFRQPLPALRGQAQQRILSEQRILHFTRVWHACGASFVLPG